MKEHIYHKSRAKHLLVLIERFHKRKGYGVHSPTAYYIIRNVFFEKCVYYDYARLQPAVSSTRKHYGKWVESTQIYKLLFRLVNDVQPEYVIEVGRGIGLTTIYLASPCKHIPVVSIDSEREADISHFVQDTVNRYAPNVELKSGNIKNQFEATLSDAGDKCPFFLIRPELLDTDLSVEIIIEAVKAAKMKSIVVITGIYSNKQMRDLWNDLKVLSKTGVTFDLYELGIIYFDKTFSKRNYLIHF